MKMKIRVKEKYTCTIDKLVYKGYGLGYIDRFTVFVPNGLPGDTVEIEITQRKRTHAYGKIINLIKPSDLRGHSSCKHSQLCGGCQIIDISYDDQLKLKESIILDSIHQFFPEAKEHLKPIIPATINTFYRNKMDFSFGKDSNNSVYAGLKERGKYDHVVPIKTCLLQSELSNKIRDYISKYFSEANTSTWDYHTHTGLLRYVVIRHSKTLDEYLINFIISENKKELIEPLSKELVSHFPEIKSVLCSIQPEISDSSFATESEIIQGPGFLKEEIEGTSFIISPQSFFQTNTEQMKVLYKQILLLSKPSSEDVLIDLYCGTGTIGLYLSKHVKKVIGIEENTSSINDAEKNATINNISNTKFMLGRVKNILKFNSFNVDWVIVDPPRSGMVPKALKRMIELDAPKITYVSCNPVTLLRDLKIICEAGYEIQTFQPVDMFPNTFHIESIVVLEKIKQTN
jgi:23S rRNA (uracil1939-C5)-methyltransferase